MVLTAARASRHSARDEKRQSYRKDGQDSEHEQTAGRVGEGRDAFFDLLTHIFELGVGHRTVCFGTASFFAVEVLALEPIV